MSSNQIESLFTDNKTTVWGKICGQNPQRGNKAAAVTARKVNRFNRLTESICEQTNVCFIDNRNILAHHLNRSNLHLNSNGSKVLGSNLCRYLRRANLPPSGQELTTKLATGFRQDHFRVRKPLTHTTMWTNYLSQVRDMTNHWTWLLILVRIVWVTVPWIHLT